MGDVFAERTGRECPKQNYLTTHGCGLRSMVWLGLRFSTLRVRRKRAVTLLGSSPWSLLSLRPLSRARGRQDAPGLNYSTSNEMQNGE